MPAGNRLPPPPAPHGRRQARTSIAAAVAVLVLVVAARPSVAATPGPAEVEAFMASNGLTCTSGPEPSGGTRFRCMSQEQAPMGIPTRGAQYVVDPTGAVTVLSIETATRGLTPPTSGDLEYLVGGAALRCDDEAGVLETFIVDNGTAVRRSQPGPGDALTFAGSDCVLRMSTAASGNVEDPNVNQLFLSILPAPAVESAPPAVGAPSATPDSSVAPSGEPPSGAPSPPTIGGSGSGGGPPVAGGISFANSIPLPAHVSTDPLVVAQSLALALLVVVLMPFPGQLFNSTLEAHEAEVRRWLRLDGWGRLGRVAGSFWQSPAGVAVFALVSAALYGLLDPGFGLDAASTATFLGMLGGIVVVTVAFATPAWLLHGRSARPTVKVVPVSLLVGVACVAISRLTGFQPGYLYGLLIGLVFARELSRAEEARTVAGGAALMLASALVAWLGLSVIPPGNEAVLPVTATRTALGAVMVAGLEGVAFGLLPFRFLPGESLFAANRGLWAVLLGMGSFAFFHVLINPTSGYLADTSRTPLLTTLALLVGFGLASVAFWGWFRFREPLRPGGATSSQP